MKENIQNHYDSHARFYEDWTGEDAGGYHFGFPKKFSEIFSNQQMIRNLTGLVVDELKIQPGQTILDAGCGAGHVALEIEKKFSTQDLKVFGVTLSGEQFRRAQEKIKSSSSKVHIYQESFEATSFPDAAFDTVFFVDAMCHGEAENKEKALQEITRILKPGGTLLVCDVFLQNNPKNLGKYFNFINNRVKNAWAVDDWTVESLFLKRAQSFGLQKVREEDLTWRIPPSVLYAPLKWLPVSVIRSIYKPEYRKVRKTLINVGFFAPLLGIHSAFRYKLMVFTK
jgi:cyclopropane fatty-acyl-phospholipid synthase-like methyltransferase